MTVAIKENVQDVWDSLRDIPVDEDDNTESEFKHFPVGTNKFDIWFWIEEEFDVSIAEDLMNCGDAITG
jgi:hypothetical protein